MRIAQLIETDAPGGAEVMLTNLSLALRERGHTVVPVLPAPARGWLSETLRGHGFEPRAFTMRRALDLGALRDLTRLFREEGIEIAHSHEFTLAVYGAAAARRVGVPHLVTMHGGRYYAGRLRRRLALRWALRRSQAAVAVSGPTRDDLVRTLGIPGSRIEVVMNGVAIEAGDRERARAELGLEGSEVLILTVGRLVAEKDHATLVDAVAALAREDLPPWRVAIAGSGPLAAEIEERVRERGVSERVLLLGFRDDVADLLAAADIFVLSSVSEGHPLALVEAMLAGLPSVATRVGGVPELVREGVTGGLVPPGDPDTLARSLAGLVSDREARLRLGSAGREVARGEYRLDRMVDDYERLYRSVAKGV